MFVRAGRKDIKRSFKLIAITYSTDATIEEILKKGNFDDIRDEIELYGRLGDLLLISGDSFNFSHLFRQVTHIPCGFRIRRPISWILFYFKAFYTLSKNSSQIDVVRAFGTGCPHALLFSILYRKPIIVSLEYDWPEQLFIAGRGTLAPLAKIIETIALRFSTVVICLSGRLCEKAKTTGAKHVVYIPNSIDFNSLPRPSAEELNNIRSHVMASGKKIVLFAGRLHRIKKVDDLIKAFTLILRKRRDLILVIIGEGEEKEELFRMAEDLRISGNVFFLGALGRSDVLRYMRVADVFVLPSEMEGNPKVLLEAMASKLPIVACNVAGINDLLENNVTGVLVGPSDPQKLANSIGMVISNSEFARKNAERAYSKVVSDFNRVKVGRRSLALVSSVIHKRST